MRGSIVWSTVRLVLDLSVSVVHARDSCHHKSTCAGEYFMY